MKSIFHRVKDSRLPELRRFGQVEVLVFNIEDGTMDIAVDEAVLDYMKFIARTQEDFRDEGN